MCVCSCVRASISECLLFFRHFIVLNGLTRCFRRPVSCHRRALFHPHCTWFFWFWFPSQSVCVCVCLYCTVLYTTQVCVCVCVCVLDSSTAYRQMAAQTCILGGGAVQQLVCTGIFWLCRV